MQGHPQIPSQQLLKLTRSQPVSSSISLSLRFVLVTSSLAEDASEAQGSAEAASMEHKHRSLATSIYSPAISKPGPQRPSAGSPGVHQRPSKPQASPGKQKHRKAAKKPLPQRKVAKPASELNASGLIVEGDVPSACQPGGQPQQENLSSQEVNGMPTRAISGWSCLLPFLILG